MILPPPKKTAVPTSIDEILASEDELNLLANVQPMGTKAPLARGIDTRVNNFLEIVDFVSSSGREPDMENLSERSLARRLKKYREDKQLRAAVTQYDTLGLLGDAPEEVPSAGQVQEEDKAPSSLEDIFASNDLGLLDDINYDIFNLEHVKANNVSEERDIPDIIGRQRPCADFERYSELFDALASALKTKNVIRRSFTSKSSLRQGQFFLLRGQLCYIAAKLQEGDYKGLDNPRFLVIFDNHTEIEILKLSLARALYADKQSKWLDCAPNLLSVADEAGGQTNVSHTLSGYIYILETLSTAPELASWKLGRTLVKIGYTTTSIEERLRNAEKDCTYLCAPVRLVHTIKCYNLNAHTFEKLIHAFLHDRRLGITMIDNNGKAYRPEEWFTVSAETALEAARHIIDGTISQYRLDSTSGTIKPLAR